MRIFLQQAMWALGVFMCVAGAEAAEPTYKEGETIFVETGVEAPDRSPTWYASMVAKPYAPVFEMLATQGTQGRYYPYTYPVTLKDLVRFHGHDCEGTTSAANAAWMAFKILFPGGIIDRSVLWGISGESPCWSDAVAFLTGARLQYGNLGFFKDKRYSHAIVLYREDTKVAVLATWKEGINNIPGEPVMLPGKVTWQPKVTMKDVEALKAVVKKAGGNPTPTRSISCAISNGRISTISSNTRLKKAIRPRSSRTSGGKTGSTRPRPSPSPTCARTRA